METPRQSIRRAGLKTRSGLPSQARNEDGIILLAVLFLVVLVLVALAVAAPQMARSIQRDKEIELQHRGEQYKHAIKLYYKKFGAYPTSIDQLVSTNQIRFLRKRYKDPITGLDDWRIIHLGEAKVPPMGFFGQPLGAAGGAANIGTPVGSATGGSFMGTPAGGTSATGPSGFGSSGLGSSTDPTASSPGTDSGASTPSDSTNGSGSTDSGTSGSGFGNSPTGGTVTTATGTGSSAFGSPAIGGGPIVGVGIPSAKASILEYKKQKHYNQWEFVYNPLEEQMAAASIFGGSAANANGTTPGGSTPTSTTPGTPTPTPSGPPATPSPNPFPDNSQQ
jgi:type II secretory pathway pseudopilin PulG